MPRLKTFLTLFIAVTSLFIICGCGFFRQQPGAAEPYAESDEIPQWLMLSYRQSGPLNFDYVPLDSEEIETASGENEEGNDKQESASAGSGGSYRPPNPTGSPYEAGTIDDMIWQQKQRDKQ